MPRPESPAPGRVSITGVTAYGHHGVLDHEKRDGQDFVVDVVMEIDITAAAEHDDLSRTVNYADVARDVVAVVEGPSLDLIEALASRIADAVLAREPVESVEVTVHKPHAPVGVPFGDVTVQLRRDRDIPVVIAVGANLGDAERTVRAAARGLRRVRGLHGVRLSPLYRTAPVGGPAQDDYTNAVVLARTRLAPPSLLTALHRLEQASGRTREVRWGPRSLDLDLIQYGTPGTAGEVTSAVPELLLPHPRAHERAFVLQPWADADPVAELRVGERVLPVTDVLAGLDRTGVLQLPPRRGWNRRRDGNRNGPRDSHPENGQGGDPGAQ